MVLPTLLPGAAQPLSLLRQTGYAIGSIPCKQPLAWGTHPGNGTAFVSYIPLTYGCFISVTVQDNPTPDATMFSSCMCRALTGGWHGNLSPMNNRVFVSDFVQVDRWLRTCMGLWMKDRLLLLSMWCCPYDCDQGLFTCSNPQQHEITSWTHPNETLSRL